MRRFLAGLLSIMLLLIPTPALAADVGPAESTTPSANEAGPTDAAPAEASEAGPAEGSADAAAAGGNEAALNLLKKVNEIQEGKFLGEVRIEADAGGFGVWARMGVEAYAQGENALLYYKANLVGQSLDVGMARYDNATWFSTDGVWMPLSAPAGSPDPMEVMEGLAAAGALDAVAEDLLKTAQVTLSEETVEGITYDVVHLTLDKDALAAMMEQVLGALETNPVTGPSAGSMGELEEFAVSGSYWVVRETQDLYRITTEVSAKVSEPALAITAVGDLYFYPLEGPIPFPQEITSPAPGLVFPVPPLENAGTLPPAQELMAKFKGGGFKASGQIYASVDSETTWAGSRLDAELFTKDGQRVARTKGHLLDTTVQSGVAVRGDARWTLGAQGSWQQSDGVLTGVGPFDNPAAFLVLPDSLMDMEHTTVYELGFLDRPVYAIEMQGDAAAFTSLFGVKVAEDAGNEVSITLLLDKETGMPVELDLSIWFEDEQGMTQSLYGTLQVELLEGPLPFPVESSASL